MNLQSLLEAPRGSSQLVVASPAELENALRSLDQVTGALVEVRFLRGKKMRTKEGLLDEFAAALQFPCYFGENWDALRDSLSMLPLLQSGSVLVCVWDATEVLKSSTPEDRETLGRVIEQVKADRSVKSSGHTLQWAWQVTPEAESDLREKWSKLGLA